MAESADVSYDDGGGQSSDTPPYDAQAVGRVASRIQIRDVVLTGLHFSRLDDGPVEGPLPSAATPEDIGIAVGGWELVDDVLGCSLRFRTFFDDDAEEPYSVMASYRLVYDVVKPASEGFADSDVTAFVHWNVVFNAWPYWRELLSSVMNRAQLPRHIVPVLGLPKQDALASE